MCVPLIPLALSAVTSTISGIGAAASGIWGALVGGGAAAGAAGTAASAGGAAAAGAATAATTAGGLSLGSILSSPWLLGASAVLSGTSAMAGASAANKANQYNAALSEAQAKDAEIRGQQQEERVRRATAQLIGDQRVNMASSGVELSSGTPVDLIAESAYFGEQDALTVRFNASRETMSKRTEAQMYRSMRQNGALAAGTSVLSSLSPLALKYSNGTRT